jgi:hypothetical protein
MSTRGPRRVPRAGSRGWVAPHRRAGAVCAEPGSRSPPAWTRRLVPEIATEGSCLRVRMPLRRVPSIVGVGGNRTGRRRPAGPGRHAAAEIRLSGDRDLARRMLDDPGSAGRRRRLAGRRGRLLAVWRRADAGRCVPGCAVAGPVPARSVPRGRIRSSGIGSRPTGEGARGSSRRCSAETAERIACGAGAR